MFSSRQIFAFVIVLLLAPSLILADTVLLRNGQRIEGKIVGQSRTTVRIRTQGGTRSIPKANVRRIVYGAVNNKAKEERDRKRKERQERLKKLREERQKALEERKKQEAEDAEQRAAEAEAARKREEAERLRQLQEAESAARAGAVTLPGALTRSALLPGLGQIYQGRTGAGAAYMGSFILLAGATGAAIAHHDFTRRQYLSAAEEAFIYTPFFFDLIGPVSSVNSSTLSRDEFTQLGLIRRLAVADARAEMVRAGEVADISRTLLLGFYLWNLTDTFLFHPRGAGNTAFGMYLAPETAGNQFQYRF